MTRPLPRAVPCLAFMLAATLPRPTSAQEAAIPERTVPNRAERAAGERRPISVDDLYRLRDVSDPRISPEGDWVAYTVTRADSTEDDDDSDLWMESWDGTRSLQLTYSDRSEWAPRWSPDGRWIAFLSARDEEAEASQVWLLDRAGGEARRITDFPGGVSDLAWSPDGTRLALVVRDPEPEGEPGAPAPADPGAVEPPPGDPGAVGTGAGDPAHEEADEDEERPEPIVIDRLHFKEDGTGFLRHRRDHLHVLDAESGESFQLTRGDFDHSLPAWSPDGRSLAFVSERGPEPDRTGDTNLYVVDAEPGAEPRRLTTFEGRDGGTWYGGPVWSPDGRRLAYVRGETPELMWYGLWRLAVVPVEGGEARVLTRGLDRNVWRPAWSADGSSILFLLEDDRRTHLARIPAAGGHPERLTRGRCYVSAYSSGPGGRVALLASSPLRPAEVWALEPGEEPASCADPASAGRDGAAAADAPDVAARAASEAGAGGNAPSARRDGALRRLSRHNDDWLREVRLAPVEEIEFDSRDGTRIGGFLVRPRTGEPPHPTLLRLHGGPVWQFFDDFHFEWQVLAAHGYAVVAPNPRGSSGRGESFQAAIFADWGNLDGEDALAAVEHAVEMGVADPARLGVGGWSYGGILTNALIVQDDRFAAAISGAGMGNMLAGYGHDQYVREWETELGAPWENTDLWLRLSAPFLQADRIVTPTMFVCGQEDWNVPLIASEQMYQALRSLGRETLLVVYPGEDHSIDRPSFRADRLRRYLDWYGRFLNHHGKEKRP